MECKRPGKYVFSCFEKASTADGKVRYTKGDTSYTTSKATSGSETAYRNEGGKQTHKIRLKDDE
jgi:hypothetical protein